MGKLCEKGERKNRKRGSTIEEQEVSIVEEGGGNSNREKGLEAKGCTKQRTFGDLAIAQSLIRGIVKKPTYKLIADPNPSTSIILLVVLGTTATTLWDQIMDQHLFFFWA